MDYEVTCVTFVIPGDRTSGIAMLGVGGARGAPADQLTRREVAERIVKRLDRFFVLGPGLMSPPAFLTAHRGVDGDWIVQTEPDGVYDNNLLSLPACPALALGNLLRPQ